jgi:hypothetical protein
MKEVGNLIYSKKRGGINCFIIFENLKYTN